MSIIHSIVAREILDSRLNPAVEVEIWTESGFLGRIVPSIEIDNINRYGLGVFCSGIEKDIIDENIDCSCAYDYQVLEGLSRQLSLNFQKNNTLQDRKLIKAHEEKINYCLLFELNYSDGSRFLLPRPFT